jgi:hypothetical protein
MNHHRVMVGSPHIKINRKDSEQLARSEEKIDMINTIIYPCHIQRGIPCTKSASDSRSNNAWRLLPDKQVTTSHSYHVGSLARLIDWVN